MNRNKSSHYIQAHTSPPDSTPCSTVSTPATLIVRDIVLLPPHTKSERAASKEYFQMIVLNGEEQTFLQIEEGKRWFSNVDTIKYGIKANGSLNIRDTTAKTKM